jgi:hypothetical protein
VDVLERLAKTLEAPVRELFKAVRPNAPKPKPLQAGEKGRTAESIGS